MFESVVLIACCAVPSGCGTQSGAFAPATPKHICESGNEGSSTGLAVSAEMIDFGIVPQGQERRHYVELKNTTGQPIQIGRIETTCDCLLVRLASEQLEPGETSLACLHLDLSLASEFTGTLAIDVAGMSNDVKAVFSVKVHVNVRPVSEFSAFEEPELPQVEVSPSPVPMP